MTSMDGRRLLPKQLAWLEHAKLSDAGEAAVSADTIRLRREARLGATHPMPGSTSLDAL